MRLSDTVWRLNRNYGICESTFSEVMREGVNEEFFVSKSDAHRADADRCKKEAERSAYDEASWKERELAARKLVLP